MVIVVKVILDATVALVDLTASLHRALIRGLGGPQIVTERLYIKVQPHCANSHCWDRCCSSLHLKEGDTKEDHGRISSRDYTLHYT